MIRVRINSNRTLFITAVICLVWAVSCDHQHNALGDVDGVVTVVVPATFADLPASPADNDLTVARVALGRMLFSETALSADGRVSCASCHKADLAYADTVAISQGVHGNADARNSPSLLNVAYQKALFAEGGIPNLETQVLAPFGNPNEMALSVKDAAALLAHVPAYDSLSRKAYGTAMDAYVMARALAAFQRTLVSSGSPYDAFLLGDSNALSLSAIRGKELFFSQKTACSTCHSGFLLTDQNYYNIGLYTTYLDEGRGRLTLKEADLGKFKTPSLRNVALTPPYMHNGSMATLEDVLRHFNDGGVGHPNQHPDVKPLGLDDGEMDDLKNFLQALTDTSFNATYAKY